jgi:50S ribosomal subunit-associated GTPase HflX
VSLDVFNKCDLLHPAELERLQRREPDALCISAATGLGRDDLIDAVTARLALDVRRIVVQLDPESEADRQRLAQIYRFGKVEQHTEHDGQVWIEADVPRRLWSRLQRGTGEGA